MCGVTHLWNQTGGPTGRVKDGPLSPVRLAMGRVEVPPLSGQHVHG